MKRRAFLHSTSATALITSLPAQQPGKPFQLLLRSSWQAGKPYGIGGITMNDREIAGVCCY